MSSYTPIYAAVPVAQYDASSDYIRLAEIDGLYICSTLMRADDVEYHLAACDKCYRTRDDVLAAYPALDGTKAVDNGDGTTSEVPLLGAGVWS